MPVPTEPVSDADRELIAEAETVLADHFDPQRHVVASALRTGSGRTYSAINLVTSVGNADVHCEPITVGNAVVDGETDFDATVAVYYPERDPGNDPAVVSACGVCRELLCDFDPTTKVVYEDGDDLVKASVADLLPAKGQ